MHWNLDIEAPTNGKLHKAMVTVRDDMGQIQFTDKADLMAMSERRKLAKRLSERLGVEATEIQERLEAGWAALLNDRMRGQESVGAGKASNDIIMEILDSSPDVIRRPLSLIKGQAYASTWLNVQATTRQVVNPQTGEVKVYDPPLVQSVSRLAVIRSDGQMFAANVPQARPLTELGVDVSLPSPVPAERAWSGAGVKRFLAGERPKPAEVLHRACTVIDRFMDFSRSLTSQGCMCEMVACYTLSTYLLDAFNVVGYLWPNGDKGTGKTNFLSVVAEMAYLGQVILAGGSYASLRDLADYGATLAFDDAEGVMDVRRSDPDKRALLLAGNRRGTTVTVKEPTTDRGWATRHIHAFSSRLFSAIRLPDDVLASRSIVVPLVRSADSERAKRTPLAADDWPCDRRRLVDDLWATGVFFLPELPAFDVKAARKAQLCGRNLEPWRGILAVALWLQEHHGVDGLFERMQKLSVDYQTERGDLETNDPVHIAIKALARMVKDLDGDLAFATKELAGHMNTIAIEEEIADGNEKPFTNSRKVGWLLKKQRFRKAPRATDGRQWVTSAAEIASLARSYGIRT
jgi:hypothetical protein